MRPRGVHTAARRVGAKAAANYARPSVACSRCWWCGGRQVLCQAGLAVMVWQLCASEDRAWPQATPDAARAKGAKGLSLAARLTLAPNPSWRETRYTLHLQVQSARP